MPQKAVIRERRTFMQRIVTLEQMKLMEKLSDESGVSYDELMINAGQKLAEIIIKSDVSENVLFLCGNGNNAGDCFVAAKYLAENNFKVSVALLCGKPKSQLAIKHFNAINDLVYVTDNFNNIKELANLNPVIVDGVFGTGFHGELNSEIKEIFNISKNADLKIAVDVPSGGNCVSGNVSEATFQADITVTFAFPKFGMMQYPLHDYCGDIITVDIGITDKIVGKSVDIPIYLIDDEFVISNIRTRPSVAHKGYFGKQINVCGSNRMSGACMLAGKAALRCGLGLLISATPQSSADRTAVFIPAGMILPLDADKEGFALFDSNYDTLLDYSKSATSMLIGCGLGVTDDTKKLVVSLIKNVGCPLVLDADGINCISDCTDILNEINNTPVTLTPHPAEMARLLHTSVSDVQNNRLNSALSFSEEYKCITVLKGAGTIIASADKVYVNINGNSGMSCGGSGDVLAGMTASFIAQGIEPLTAAALAVFLHGKCGDIARDNFSDVCMLPTDIIDSLPIAFKEYRNRVGK